MSTPSRTTDDALIWERLIRFNPELSPTAARALLRLRFSEDDLESMRVLSAKARRGGLTRDEKRTIETYERLGCLLDILHSKARLVLKRRRRAS